MSTGAKVAIVIALLAVAGIGAYYYSQNSTTP
jgi:hypothetical protein